MALKKKMELGFQEFSERYIPSKLPTNWHHKLFYDILDNKVIQKEDGKLYLNTYVDKKGVFVPYGTPQSEPARENNSILMLAPRFHAKSQIFTINYCLWQIYKNPNVRIIIVSVNEPVAVSFNRAIMNQLQYNQNLIEDYGYMVPDFQEKQKWGEKALIVGRDSLEKDPTISAIGAGGGLVSKRADIIILDDLIDINSARTKAGRDKTREWFENVLAPILEDNGKLIVAGTSWYLGDIYDTLWKESAFDIKLKLKALIYNPKYLNNATGVKYIPYRLHEWSQALDAGTIFSDELMKYYHLYENLKCGVLWEKKWSFKKLMAKMQKTNMSMSSFLRQYLNEPGSEEEKVFKESHIKKSLEMGARKALISSWDNLNPQYNYGYGHLITACGVDLAISKKSQSDNSALAVWGINEKRQRILLYLDYGKWSPDETKVNVHSAYDNFHLVKVRVENVAFQDMMRQELAADDIPVEGFHTTSGRKFNEETGLAHIAMLAEQEKLIIPSDQSNKEYYKRVLQLLYEMRSYSYDQHAGDLLMASWFALDVLRDFDKKMRDNRGYFETNAMVEQMKNVIASHRVVLLGQNGPAFKFAHTSLLYIFRPVSLYQNFIEENEKFFFFCTKEKKCIAYIIEKITGDIVGKIEGDTSALMFAQLLERCGYYFNKAQIIVDRSGEGSAVLSELQKRFYPNLMCVQPDRDGIPLPREGFEITEANLPLAVETFKQNVDGLNVRVPDDSLLKEMGDMIDVNGKSLNMGYGSGQRIKTVAIALWLIDNYENLDRKLYNQPKRHKAKKINIPYLVFKQ